MMCKKRSFCANLYNFHFFQTKPIHILQKFGAPEEIRCQLWKKESNILYRISMKWKKNFVKHLLFMVFRYQYIIEKVFHAIAHQVYDFTRKVSIEVEELCSLVLHFCSCFIPSKLLYSANFLLRSVIMHYWVNFMFSLSSYSVDSFLGNTWMFQLHYCPFRMNWQVMFIPRAKNDIMIYF